MDLLKPVAFIAARISAARVDIREIDPDVRFTADTKGVLSDGRPFFIAMEERHLCGKELDGFVVLRHAQFSLSARQLEVMEALARTRVR